MENTQALTLAEVLRPLVQLCINLSGKNGRNWFDALKRFLRKEEPWGVFKWDVLATAKIGKPRPIAELLDLITKIGYEVFKDVDIADEVIKFNPIEEDVYFVSVTPKQLGMKPGYTRKDFFEKASAEGLNLCLSGDVLELVSQNLLKLKVFNISSTDSVFFAMEPFGELFKDNGNFPKIGITRSIFGAFHSWSGSYHFILCGGPMDYSTNQSKHTDCTKSKYVFRMKKKSF